MSMKECFSKKILVADDLPAARADLVQILMDIGFTNIDEAINGKEAWEKLKDQAFFGDPYDLLITDIYMPFMNGVHLLKKARAVDIYKKIPIVLISTENEKAEIIKAIAEGATSYFIKPFDPFIVKERLLSILLA